MPSGRRGIGKQHQNGGRSRLFRNRNVASISPPENITSTVKAESPLENVTAPAVSHPVIPDLEPLGSVSFEMLFLLYLHTALFCQYIYLFKTVWWYPVALPPSTTSLNFHLIDRQLTLFLAVFLSRRLIWSFLWDLLRPKSDNAPGIMVWILVCFFVGILWVCFLIGPLIYLYYSTTLMNMLVLCYPILLWLPLAGLSGDSCINLVITWASVDDMGDGASGPQDGFNSLNKPKTCVGGMSRLIDNPETVAGKKTCYDGLGNVLEAQQIRDEVRVLCRDFNSRISEIVFCSMVCAYYVGLVPMFFMKSHQYYDMLWCLQQTVLVLFNSFMLLSSQLFNPQYLHVLHKCASLLGGYRAEPEMDSESDQDGEDSNDERRGVQNVDGGIQEWSSAAVYPPGTRVQLRGKVYTSIGRYNAAKPSDVMHSRFYFMFNNPLRIMNWSVLAHSIIVLFQIYLLVNSSNWDRLVSVALLQFFSYYVMFRSLRDRIVLGKAHDLHEQVFKDCP